MNRHKGFTLIELLIVITIIGLLVALLLPAVRAAWELSLMLKCQGNMRQICIAMVSFAAEHGDKLPGGEWDPPSVEWMGNPGDLRVRHLDDRASILWRCPQHGSLFPYVQDERVYLCPRDWYSSVEETRARGGPPPLVRGSGLGNGRFSYTMPSLLVGASVARLSQCHSEYTDLEGVRQRMNVPLLIEEDTEYWVAYGYPDGSWGSSDAFSDRHFNGCNIGYLDGHVEHRQMPPGMNAYDLYLYTPKGSSITFGRHGFRWASGLDDWYVGQ